MKTLSEIYNEIAERRLWIEAQQFDELTESERRDYVLAIALQRAWDQTVKQLSTNGVAA